MTAIEASNLANEYRNLWPYHQPRNMQRAKEILASLRANGWRRLAELLQEEG